MIQVTRLQISPVKALSLVECERVRLDHDGVGEDRRLFLVGEGGAVVTQRQHPMLTQLVPSLDLGAGRLEVTFPDGSRVADDLADVGEAVSPTLFGRQRPGRLLCGPIGEALSRFTGSTLHVALADRVGAGWDEGPVSLLARASAEAVEPPYDGAAVTRRFRMLVEVDGPAAYEEESWVGRRLALGDAVVRVSHPLGRCVVIDHSSRTGEKDWKGVQQLTQARPEAGPTLGVIATVESPGEVAVGDRVDVLTS